ncbi:hypothetical protein EN803_34125, partial [Mesorhizobium sp. M2D.F.Ca.ET.160.01.1.1]
GERGAVVAGFASRQRCWRGAGGAASPLLPATIREVPGRAMTGGANPDNRFETIASSGKAVHPAHRGWEISR